MRNYLLASGNYCCHPYVSLKQGSGRLSAHRSEITFQGNFLTRLSVATSIHGLRNALRRALKQSARALYSLHWPVAEGALNETSVAQDARSRFIHERRKYRGRYFRSDDGGNWPMQAYMNL